MRKNLNAIQLTDRFPMIRQTRQANRSRASCLNRLGIGAFCLIIGAPVFAQTQPAVQPLPILQGRPDQASQSLIGPVYEDRLQGISLNPPAQAKIVRQGIAAGEIVEFLNSDKGWALKVSRADLPKPIPMTSTAAAGGANTGLLDLTAQQFKDANPAATILLQKVTQIGSHDVGLLSAHYSQSAQDRLMQQAIFRFNDQVYYVLTMTSPAAGRRSAPDAQANENQATETFNQVIHSVTLMDRSQIKQDQDNRLFRTRAFYVNLKPEDIQHVLAGEQFLRLIKDGRDIGYSYVTEEPEKRFGADGFRIGIRSHSEPSPGTQVDSETMLTCSYDRRLEEWSIGLLAKDAKGNKTALSEFGSSNQDVEHIYDPIHGQTDPKDPRQPPVRTQNTYTLHVTEIQPNTPDRSIVRQLPPFYVPQALGYLLPQLLAVHQPKTYMFATWSEREHEVVARYLDVGKEQTVDLNGKTVHAVPVEDRLGLEGAITTHYVTIDGKYLGSISDATGVTTTVTDRQTLQNLWKDPNLTPPGDSQPSPPAASPLPNAN